LGDSLPQRARTRVGDSFPRAEISIADNPRESIKIYKTCANLASSRAQVMTLLELLMLAELISARRILKTKLLDFLGLPENCQDQTDHLVNRIVSLLEANPAEQERFWETFKSELAVDPVELEAILKCSPAERQQWIEQDKLPILEYRSFRKSGIHLEYPVHDRRFILSLTPTDINNWRKEPKGLIKNNRPIPTPIHTEKPEENEQ